MAMNKKLVIVGLIAVVLVVAAIIGGIVAAKKIASSKKKANSKKPVTKSQKAVTAICEKTSFQDQCMEALNPVANNESATVKDYVMAAFQATVEKVKKALDMTGKVDVSKEPDEYNQRTLEDCKELLNEAIETIQAAISEVGDLAMHTLEDRANEFRSWLTGVYALQTTCMDQLVKPEYKSFIENGMINATQLTNNAIDILAELADIFKSFGLDLRKLGKRRLLGSQDLDANGFPSWFRIGDRRLLQAQAQGKAKPHVTVSKDGKGDYMTIKDAVASYPPKHQGRYIIYVKAGIYEEVVVIDSKKPNIFIYGDGSGRTIISAQLNNKKDVPTMWTATFACDADGFLAKDMTFRNVAGPEGHQAVALRLKSKNAAVFDCAIEGYQDTLYYQAFRQFYRNCVISGTIDFIFGKGDCVIQNSVLVVRKPLDNQMNTVTADGREVENGSNGLVLQNCKIVAEDALIPVKAKIQSYLGRPWKKDSRTVVMQSDIGDFINPEGWLPWDTKNASLFYHKTCEVLEYANRGRGAATDKRSKLFTKFKVLSPQEAGKYTVRNFIEGQNWLKDNVGPVQLDL